MTTIKCPCIECIHNENNVCVAEEITLTSRNMATVNEGNVDMWICNQYAMNESFINFTDKFNKYLKDKKLINS